MIQLRSTLLVLFALLAACSPLTAQQKKEFIPRRQDKPPGPPLSPTEAMQKMQVPPGFTVELVASEPQIVNPVVAMCFDERGRIWVAESLEYPRRRPGKGRDRVKVLEDTNGDGKVDKTTVFADGLNIPSGIAVGYGGVWVANAPDLLFLQDTNGDGKADKREVVVTGFGRTDTHELPNSLTWGPDGWLYGLNGVFNHSHVHYANGNPNYDAKHPGWKFTCAMFRIHPRTRKFEVFAEGTSNPWGIAFNNDGEAFISACVIDHLWHITETGYYHRQGGPYPPHTWKIGSIVKHKHQKAAYCGLHYYDSDAYPEEYRGHLYMGNIHGGCINVDTLQRDGSTYSAKPRPDFLTANDVWFMPVAQKTGPDGCLYILDWYDRYHCYQDANADPKGVDRLHGRLYRIRYKNTPRAKPFDLAKETDDQLIQRLHGGNGLLRRLARRILTERNDASTKPKLRKLVFDDEAKRMTRLNALWALIGTGSLEEAFHLQVLKHEDPTFRAWGVRAAGMESRKSLMLLKRIGERSKDSSPIVRLQLAIAIRKMGVTPVIEMGTFGDLSQSMGSDKLLPHILWNNVRPALGSKFDNMFYEDLAKSDFKSNPGASGLLSNVTEWILSQEHPDTAELLALLNQLDKQNSPEGLSAATGVLERMIQRAENRELKPRLAMFLKSIVHPPTAAELQTAPKPRQAYLFASMRLGALLRNPDAIRLTARIADGKDEPSDRRLAAISALIAIDAEAVRATVDTILANPESNSADFRGKLIAELGRLKDDKVADVVLTHYAKLEPELQPKAVELLAQRVNWSRKLLAAIGEKKVPANAVNLNQARQLLAFKNDDLSKLVRDNWGVVRTTRDPKRAEYVAEWKRYLAENPGDAYRGEKVFKKVCAQCHKIYDEGVDVGPDVTRNGRNSYDQLLSNVFDPSLVIGSAYRAWTVATTEGRIVTGLLVEDSPQRIVLKVQGGKTETIPRGDVEFSRESETSMMPEQLEKQLKKEEIADLFAFLALDRHPKDQKARRLPGAPMRMRE